MSIITRFTRDTACIPMITASLAATPVNPSGDQWLDHQARHPRCGKIDHSRCGTPCGKPQPTRSPTINSNNPEHGVNNRQAARLQSTPPPPPKPKCPTRNNQALPRRRLNDTPETQRQKRCRGLSDRGPCWRFNAKLTTSHSFWNPVETVCVDKKSGDAAVR